MKLLLFNHSFFNISETFIYKQVTGLPVDVYPSLLSFRFINDELFPLNTKKLKAERFSNKLDKLLTSALAKYAHYDRGFSLMEYPKVKTLLKQEQFDLVHAHFGFNAAIIYPLAKALNLPLVVTFHGVDASPQMLKDKKYKDSVERIVEYAKGVIIVSPHMIQTLNLDKWLSKVRVIPCGVDTDQFKNDFVNRVSSQKLKVLHSGRLVSKKGVPDLIRVFKNATKKFDAELHIIGEGPELAECQSIAHGEQNIFFYGALSHEQVKQHMQQCDIFVLNSRIGETGDMEGLPVSILEAMSMELPVLSTRHAGIPQAITDGEDGLLVNEKDNEALEEALVKLITDGALRKRLGTAARKKMQSQFTTARLNQNISDLYHDALS